MKMDDTHYFAGVGDLYGGKDGYGTVLNPGRLTEDTWGFAVPSGQTGTLRSGFGASYQDVSNTYGYTEQSVWAKVPLTAALIRRTDAATAGDSLDVYFGVRTSKDTAYGTYASAVTFTALPNDPVNSQDFFIELDANMIPVYYDGTTMRVADPKNPSNQWYDYASKRWANAVTVAPAALAMYKKLGVGEVVDPASVIGYFTYIPRFRYRTKALNLAEKPAMRTNFDVIFENPMTPWYKKATADNLNEPGQWMTHPAFTLGNVELPGFWMGKFVINGTESAGTTGTMIRTVPNVAAYSGTVEALWRNVTNSDWLAFRVPHSISAGTDSHLQRNSEYSAVAYLTASKYGQGLTEPTSGAAGTYLTAPAKSTTGNVTGVYDMVGVAQVVMGNLNDTVASAGFSALPDGKYIDTFSVGSVADCDSQCMGQGLAEVSGWAGATATWVSDSAPWVLRGQNSIFGYASSNGGAVTSRRVLSIDWLWTGYCRDQGYAPVLCAVLEPGA
jgi:hypothetical protein